MKQSTTHNEATTRGFTLIEMIVSMSIFIVTILIIVGALISLENASRKARTVRVVTDNMSAALDSMSRNVRMGTYLHCGCSAPYDTPQNCPMTNDEGAGGDVCLAFESQRGDPSIATDQYVYRLNANRIERSTDGGATFLALTAPELNVTTLRFYVTGTEYDDNQPYVTMVIRGQASTTPKTATEFNIQTTIGERTPNFQYLGP